ncbi:hypothetical protein YYC_04759 [Plasmodium yoelii 17X]|uniref:Early transcribed membrane protein n=4 Tax=Plasmodium yoelii TaxID=5861 RepID=Q7RIH1_PLAYO|nr:early transcribed membrane protein [Plasmodium yoelii]EAA15404.1 hypothetical protein [Plasmodium yoelii yoelii]ETB57983.1 hypothetical protein YYC_04759 [Plasmodium yoelii 17X]WBY57627.1 early transcribed membrane protein [Plasmodium yoelii yoelii]CDU18230.1 early transcribed membrane protein [Plasmodium yoelii]VTZ78647.1 early transcribed membrane protein [Plasmodium yoelii]|eukprot:XP_723839.1 early transcribed membrane protein [Plasmodium yoelii]
MKLAKALYFVAFLLAIKVLTPGSNNYVEANPPNSDKVANGGDRTLIKKIKDNKVAFISTIAATVALAIATTLGVMHYKKNAKENDSDDDIKIIPLSYPHKDPGKPINYEGNPFA